MKWVKLIGGRFLDFIITSAVITLLCVGVVQIGEHYGRIKPLSQKEIDAFRQKYRQKLGIPVEPTDKQLEPTIPEEPTKRDFTKYMLPVEPAVPEEPTKRDFTKYMLPVDSRLPDEQGIISRLITPRAIRNVTLVLSIAIGLFGVISVFGIVFRRGGLTQREGFVRVWVGVPKYFAGYFRKSNTGGE